MDDDKSIYESVHNYTKFKLVEMLINRLNDGRTKVDDMNSIEDLADEVLQTLAIAGMKFYQELREGVQMRIGIDCDGVLRDLITCITDTVKETHPQHADKILTPESWDWEQWLPFWTDDETEKYVFEDNYLDFFGVECPPIKSAVEDWKS